MAITVSPTAHPRTPPQTMSPLVTWGLGGFVLAYGLVSLPSIGLLLLPVAALLFGLAGRRVGRSGVGGAPLGAAIVLAWIAVRHRAGPGLVCTPEGCSQYLDPRPFASGALIAAALGVVLIVVQRRNRGAARRTAG